MDKQGIGVKVWCDIGLARECVIKIIGEVKAFDKNGKLLWVKPNTATTTFKNKTAQGCATGTFLAVDTARLNFSDASDAVVTPTKTAGGDGSVDYVTYEVSWTNPGASKTVNSLDIGYDLNGGGEAIYCQQTGLTDVIAGGATRKYSWTITFTYTSGGVAESYRQAAAKMVDTGAFDIPDTIHFVKDPGPTYYDETATLEDGGTGSENYHQWTATYVHSGASVVIDIIKLLYDVPGGLLHTLDDITNKTLADTETITCHIKITHN